MPFLPLTKQEMEDRGWDRPDIVVVTGDAYVDHPSFGTAIIGRVLEDAGFRVCILSQPQRAEDFARFGRPRLAFFVGSGNIDSMVAHYTAAKRRRSDDAYTAGGKAGARPDRAVIVYSRQAREAFPGVPVVIGGLEASLRRFAHYDYWDDRVRPSILMDSGADLLVFGMGERQNVEIARRLDAGEPVEALTDIRGVCWKVPVKDYRPGPCAECPSFERVRVPDEAGKKQYAISCRIQQDEHDAVRGKTVIQRHGDWMVIQNPPQPSLTTEEFDAVYELPYMREPHPSYAGAGRGTRYRGGALFPGAQPRLLRGLQFLFPGLSPGAADHVPQRGFRGAGSGAAYKNARIQGVHTRRGRPHRQFSPSFLPGQLKKGLCKGKKCLAPAPCPAMKADHSEYLHLLRRLRRLPG